jgi:hypothetical protein
MEVKRKACDELGTSMVMNHRGLVVASPARLTRTNRREASGSPTDLGFDRDGGWRKRK